MEVLWSIWLSYLAMFLRYELVSSRVYTVFWPAYNLQIGQIPTLDLLLKKNPLYLLAAQHGLVDATAPVAKFAHQHILERYSKPIDGLPTTAKDTRQDFLSKFTHAQALRPDFITDTVRLTLVVSIILAGSDTTGVSLSAVFYYLLKNPRCMKALMNELDEKARAGWFHDNESGIVTWTEAQGLPYLDACIKEAFRLHPAVGLTLERVVPAEGADIAGRWVKGGTIVGCNAWVIHRRAEIFGGDVEVYRPERWLVDEKKGVEDETKRIKDMNGNMLHFSMGSRTCIGKNVSLLEIYKLVPSILRRFEVGETK